MLTSLTKRRSADGHWPKKNYRPLFNQRLMFNSLMLVKEFDDIETILMDHIVRNVDSDIDVNRLEINANGKNISWKYWLSPEELLNEFKYSGECSFEEEDVEVFKEEFDAWKINCPEDCVKAEDNIVQLDYVNSSIDRPLTEEEHFFFIDFVCETIHSWTYEQWLRSDVTRGDILYPTDKNRAALDLANSKINDNCWKLVKVLDAVDFRPPEHCNNFTLRKDWLDGFHLQHVPLAVKSCLVQAHMLIERFYV